MSEFTKLSSNRIGFRAKLLASACGASLLVTTYQPALASEDDRPIVWIELGGAFTQLENDQEAYLPPFTQGASHLPFITVSPANLEKPMPTSWDGNAKIAFELPGMDWLLSAGIMYGRSVRSEAMRQQTAQRSPAHNIGYDAYQSTAAKNNESHMILDFQAGKDVGLGAFGNSGHSTVNFGVRYAQLNSKSDTNVLYQPTNSLHTYHKFSGSLHVERKFTGVGPSLSWDASAGLIGDAASGGISLDWGCERGDSVRSSTRARTSSDDKSWSYLCQQPTQESGLSELSSAQPQQAGDCSQSWRGCGRVVALPERKGQLRLPRRLLLRRDGWRHRHDEERMPASTAPSPRSASVSVMGRWESRPRPIISPPVSGFRS